MRQTRAIGALAGLMALGASGCSADFAGGSGSDGAGAASSGDGDGDGVSPVEDPVGAFELTRLARLTHRQYDNSASDVLRVEVTKSSEFLGDSTRSGFDNNVQGLEVTGRLGRDYRRAAEELSVEVVGNGSAYEALVPCDGGDAACRDDFLSQLGRRAFRRPLSDEELARYAELFDLGPELVASGDDFRDGVQVTLEALLQSPKFLYRAELTEEYNTAGALVLSDYEVATRLSYLIWNTTPDDGLLDAAEQGELSESDGISGQADRLLTDERSEEVVLDFHAQWLQLSHYDELSKSPAMFPDFDPSVSRDLKMETLEFVRSVTFEDEKGLASLLSAPYTMANDAVAALYGQEVSGSEFRRLDLDPSERRGLLTQIGFLASHAYADASSPIHRGVFILRQLLCSEIPPPPGSVDFTLSEEALNASTKREEVEIQTGTGGCQNCHHLINPMGFAFENFDAVGAVRTEDRGTTIDTTGTVSLDEGDFVFVDAPDLIQQLAESDAVRACYAKNWVRYGLARDGVSSDAEVISALAGELKDDNFTATELLRQLATSPRFRVRPVELQGP